MVKYSNIYVVEKALKNFPELTGRPNHRRTMIEIYRKENYENVNPPYVIEV